jgi:hypothetical protein
MRARTSAPPDTTFDTPLEINASELAIEDLSLEPWCKFVG